MPRPIWSGHIAFGLVSIPVGLHSADQTKEVSFHMIDRRNNARIRYKRVNEETGEEVPWDEIVKSYEFEDGTLITVTDEELKQVAPEANQTVEIVGFTELSSIEPAYFEKPYYLVPQKRGEKGYGLTFSPTCSGREAPTSAEATLSFWRTHATAS